MTDTLLPQTQETVRSLFEQGDCLTFDALWLPKAVSFASNLRWRNGNCFVRSKTAIFPLHYKAEFHFFSNGTLIYASSANKSAIENFERIAAAKGFPVQRKYGSFNPSEGYTLSFIRSIDSYAVNKYPYETDLEVVPLLEKRAFVDELFANGNVCLSASENDNIKANRRDYLALFSDGRFIVSEDYKSSTGIHNPYLVYDFASTYRKHVCFMPEYVPRDYLDAIYEKAAQFDWFLPRSAAEARDEERYRIPADDEKKMREFISGLIRDNVCLSVVPKNPLYSPERFKYALFADGRLTVDEKLSRISVEDLIKQIRIMHPSLEPDLQRVPSFYIPAIYKALEEKHRQAREVYLEILKQKAKRLKKMLNIPHHQALEEVARMAGWKSWQEACLVGEAQARFAVSAEKTKKEIAAAFNLDPVEWEYNNRSVKK